MECRIIACLLLVGLNAACLRGAISGSIGANGSSTAASASSTGGSVTAGAGASSTGTSTAAASSMGSSIGASSTGATSTGAGSSTGGASSTGTTGGPHGYMGYDGGPHPEPPIDVDAGCNAEAPFWIPDSGCQVCDAKNDVLCKMAGLVCDPAVNFCVQCTASQPCQVPDSCVLDSGQCAAPCPADGGSCAPGFICDGTLCHPGCNTDQDCPYGSPICRGSECFADCAYSACPDGDCLILPNFTSNPSGICLRACSIDSDCPWPDYCSRTAGVCQPGCLTASDCPTLLSYNPGDTSNGVVQGCSDAFCQSTGFASCIIDSTNSSECTNGCLPTCPGSLQCGSNDVCGCASNADCASSLAATTAPSCLDAGPPDSGILGTCGCADSSVCPAGDICERRGSENSYPGVLALNPSGVCIPRCDGDAGLSCARTFPSFQFCDPVSGQCVGCAADSDCPGTETCTAGICIAACVFDAGFDSCSVGTKLGPYAYEYPGDYCNTFTGLCVGCLDDYDCSPGRLCRPSTTSCVQCLSSADCPGNAFAFASDSLCEMDAGICGTCLQDFDCYPLGLANCTLSYPDLSCSDSCSSGTDGNCPAPLVCAGGVCSCSSDSDCQVFDSGVVPTCVQDADLRSDAGLSVCGCNATSVCPSGDICDPRFGGPGGACVPSCWDGGLDCATTTAFDYYPVCNPATGYCVECLTTQDCADAPNSAGTYRPVCVMDGGQPGFPVVGGGLCGCVTDSDCGAGLQCLNDECGF